MNLLNVIAHHGYAVTSIALFAACCGLPMPLSVVLLTAGAAAHGGSLNLGVVILCAASSALLGDTLMYLGGRYTGWWLLTNICRFSMNPELCVFASARQFYKRGPRALIVAKFIPGLATVAAILAGSLNMRLRRFLTMDGLGVLLYVSAWSLCGFVFAPFLRILIVDVERLAHFTAATVSAIILLYVLWLVLSALRESRLSAVEKVAAEDLFEMHAHGDARSAAGHRGCALAWVLRSGDAANQELDTRGAEPAEGRAGGAAGVYAAGVRDLSVLFVRA